MPRRIQRSRKPVLTLEAMVLMSATAADINVELDAGTNSDVGPLPGLDFPGEWIIESSNVATFQDLSLFFSQPEERQQTTSEAAAPSLAEITGLEVFLQDSAADSVFVEANSSDLIEIPGAIPVPPESVASLAFVSEGAGYRNTIGTYLVDEATGQISDVSNAFANASLRGSGGDLVRGDAIDLDVAQGKQLGFFILANGSGLNDLDDFADSSLEFSPARSGGTALVATDADGQSTVLNGQLYISDASKNPDGLDHFRIDATDSGMLIQIEDLPNLGDKDYDDVIVELKFEAIERVAPEFTSLSGSATYVEGQDPVVLDSNVSLNATATDSFAGATLTLQRNGGANLNDSFFASGTLSELTEGSDLTVDGTSIGRVSANVNGSLILTFNEDATTDLVNSALQQLTYSNSSDYLSGEVDIEWSFVAADESGTAIGSTSVRLIDSDRIYVTTAEREVDGDTSSIAALIANNGGTGISLEEAIIAANNTTNVDGADEIFFNIAGAGFHVISGIGQPDITEAVTIDAATESDFTDTPLVVLDGNDAAGSAFTLTSSADGTEIRGFNIRDFAGHGIVIEAGSDSNVIANNWIGRLANDGSDAGADEQIEGAGIAIFGANNYIGGMSTSEANVISGNGQQGIRISGSQAEYNVIHGNLIGTGKDGQTDLGNQWAGIRVASGAVGTIIGGADSGAGNILSGNGSFGVRITGQGTNDSVIQGNLIGTDHSGSQAIGNDVNGIRVDFGAKWTTIGGSEDGAGNVVSGNAQQGIRISNDGTDYTVIQGNVIGTDSDGSAALGNRYAGVRIDSGAKDTVVGGDFEAAGNIVSGNGAHGVRVHGAGTNDTTIQGNLIGTDSTGTEAIGNNGVGILIDGAAQGTTVGGSGELAGNVVSANEQQGVRVSGEGTDSTVIQGNVIGTNSDGTAALGNKYAGILIESGARDSVIGGDGAAVANVVSGNGTFGVRVTGENTDDTTIQGNLIGTNESGTEAIGNSGNGVRIDSGAEGTTIGGTADGAGNVISGNGTQGVRITGEGTDFSVILGNVIGTDSNGLFEVGNRFAGVLIDAEARGSVVGGSRAGSANIVSGNGTYGIRITGEGTSDHTVQGNLIGTDHTASVAIDNATSGIRIDGGATDNIIGACNVWIGCEGNAIQDEGFGTQFTEAVSPIAAQNGFVDITTLSDINNSSDESSESVTAEGFVQLSELLFSFGLDGTVGFTDDAGGLTSGLVQVRDAASSSELGEDSLDECEDGNLPEVAREAASSGSTAVSEDAVRTDLQQLNNSVDVEAFDNGAQPLLVVQDANVSSQQVRSSASSSSSKSTFRSER